MIPISEHRREIMRYSFKKYILRWVMIIVACFVYFTLITITSFQIGAFYENQSIKLTPPTSLKEYYDAIDALTSALDSINRASIYGFVISMSTILFSFKKIR